MKTKFIAIIVALTAFYSCSKEDISESEPFNSEIEVQQKDGRVVFKNTEELNQTIKHLSSNVSSEDFGPWVVSKGHNSLIENLDKYDDEQISNLPLVYLAILNTDFEFQIGENIVYYNDNKFYEIDKSSKNNRNTDDLKVIGKTEVIMSEVKSTDNQEKTVNLGVSGTYKKYKQFNRAFYRNGCGSKYRKSLKYRLVHELKAIRVNYDGLNRYTELSMNMRMVYRSSSWKPANSTERLLNFNLSGTVTSPGWAINPGNVNSRRFNIGYSYSCSNPAKGNKRFVLAGVGYNIQIGPAPEWFISMRGTINHQVNGDDTNKWSHSVNW